MKISKDAEKQANGAKSRPEVFSSPPPWRRTPEWKGPCVTLTKHLGQNKAEHIHGKKKNRLPVLIKIETALLTEP